MAARSLGQTSLEELEEEEVVVFLNQLQSSGLTKDKIQIDHTVKIVQSLQSARKGHVMAVIGGPNCRTWSKLLMRPQGGR